jgi:hypothetical protein
MEGTVVVMGEATVVVMGEVTLAGDRMLTPHPMLELTVVHTMAISSAAGQGGFTANVTSGMPSGIAGIRTVTTGRAGTFAALTGSQRANLRAAPSNSLRRNRWRRASLNNSNRVTAEH